MAKKQSRFRGRVSNDIDHHRKEGSSYGYLSLPKNVNVFKEDADNRIYLDIMPYIITEPKHPDITEATGLEPGDQWYKRPFKVHRNVGAENTSVICPTSVGKKCPICEYRAQALKDGAERDSVKDLRPSDRNLYVVIPKDHKKYDEVPHIWDISPYNFQDLLNQEIEEDTDNEVFPDLEEGFTLKIRFDEKKLGKNSFASASRIDFEERDEPYTEAIMKDIPDLDACLKIKSYNEINQLFLEIDEDDIVKEEDEEETPRKKRSKVKEPEVEEEEDIVEEEEEKPKRSRKSAKPKEVEPEEEEEEDEPVKPKRKRKAAEEIEEEEEDEAGENECPHGYEFGVDTDTKKACATCEKWDDCMDAKEQN